MAFLEKVVLITGASSGIGAAAARHLADLGAKVSMVGRNEKRLNEVAAQIKSSLPIVADVTKDTDRIVDDTIKHFGKLDVLINSAGNGSLGDVASINMAEFDSVFDLNVRSVVRLTKLCVPHLEKTKGNIVNISSLASMSSPPAMLSYSMSKAAIDQFTRSSSVDLASKGIRVNAINPSMIRTAFLEHNGVPKELSDHAFKEYDGKYPFGRVGNVNDTNEVIAFLADNKRSSFLTGILLPVDGGAFLAHIV